MRSTSANSALARWLTDPSFGRENPAFARIAVTELVVMERSRSEVRTTAQVEASGVVAAGRRELFYYTDWCYNVPEWFEPVRKARILHLPDSRGMGKVTSYAGTLFGRNMEWEAQSAEWVEDRAWAMRASRGAPAKMSMQIRFRFEAVGADSTNVTCRVSYHAPFPLVGRLVDRFYLRKEAMRLANLAVQGLRKAADHNRVPPLVAGFEKRKADHPGYGAESVEKAQLAPTES